MEEFERVVRKIDPQAQLVRAWELKGGVSAQVTAIEVARPSGQIQKMVVRRHGPTDLRQNPQVAADEYRLLEILQSAGVLAPAPYLVDQSGEIFPTPYLVIEFIEGQTVFEPADLDGYIRQFASQLSQLHRVDWSKFDLSFLTGLDHKFTGVLKARPEKLDDSLDEGLIRDKLEAAWPWPQTNRSGLLHGDYWPGNIMWQGDRLAAVIDWEDAFFGDPLVDFANSRLEILWAFGIEALEKFTRLYQAMTPLDYTNLPYWDLNSALRPAHKIGEWAPDAATEKRWRELHKIFVSQAFEKLKAR